MKLHIAPSLCVILWMVVACSSATDASLADSLITAWNACNNATSTPTGGKYSGKVFSVYNVPPGQSGKAQSGSYDVSRASASGWIDYGFWEGDKYQTFQSTYTDNLNDAGAVVCVKSTYYVIETCSYKESSSNAQFSVDRLGVDSEITLLSWPSGEVVAQISNSASNPPECGGMLFGQEASRVRVLLPHIDLMDWVLSHGSDN